MSDQVPDASLVRLSTQIEGLTSEIASLRRDIAEQRTTHSDERDALWARIDTNRKEAETTAAKHTELVGMLKGGAMVLAFFQTGIFAVIIWAFTQILQMNTAVAELKGYDQQLTLMLRQQQKKE